MPTPYTVCRGDCIASIAETNGRFWETIWKDEANAELRKARKDPNQLVPGDVVQIPDLKEKEETRPAEKCYRFRRKGVPSRLRIRVLRNGEPRKNEPFRIDVDGVLTCGTTKPDGLLEVSIPGTAMNAILYVGPDTDQDIYELSLGQLEPGTENEGVTQRLRNLGYDVGDDDDAKSDAFVNALKKFQSDNDLDPTGKLDDVTRKKLEAAHGV